MNPASLAALLIAAPLFAGILGALPSFLSVALEGPRQTGRSVRL